MSKTRRRPQEMDRLPQNWDKSVTASAAVDTASPTTHSRSPRARASGAIEVLSMFCATYVNKQMASRARSVAWAWGSAERGDEGE